VIKFLKIREEIHYHAKAYGTDLLNNHANNTFENFGSLNPPELLFYANIQHNDELISTKWIFFSYIENLSFLGGLMDISLLIPSVIMIGYCFRINEINVFFYHQIMSKWKWDQNIKFNFNDRANSMTVWKNPNTKYSEYILNNYFLISFKVGLYIVFSNLGLHKLEKCRKLIRLKKSKSKNFVLTDQKTKDSEK
jgi:hypothetical protein